MLFDNFLLLDYAVTMLTTYIACRRDSKPEHKTDCTGLPKRALTSGELARQAFRMGRKWLSASADPVAELIEERVQEDIDEGLA
jgi:hypothetical protein